MGWGGWGGPGIIGLIFSVVLWAAVLAALVVGIIWLVRKLGAPSRGTAEKETPLNAARRRLATGEITGGEFDEIVHRLRTESVPIE
jgi:uncharacterized membrane protein